ncbi:MAG: cytochrome c [Oligoflexia bacterium]|nr:cytochrome c [Oligoflexia bacterium]
MKRKLFCWACTLLSLMFAFTLVGCEKKTPDWEMTPDMYESTSFKAQKEDPNSPDGAAARIPPENTIPRGYTPFDCTETDNEKAGKTLKNPLERTKQVLERGQKIYSTYCLVCHGVKGTGEGSVVPPFPRPPSLISEKVRDWKDGNIFHVITCGQNLMPKYNVQVGVMDRWAIIHYIRGFKNEN